MTEAHYQTIDDFIQKSTVTDDRPKEEREKTTTISRCKKGQDNRYMQERTDRFLHGKYVV
jgi:hypothetical protein